MQSTGKNKERCPSGHRRRLLSRRRAGRLEAAADEIRFALEHVGFFVIVNHDVPRSLIHRTFEEARRIHSLAPGVKMALRMNEHNNGYMAMAPLHPCARRRSTRARLRT